MIADISSGFAVEFTKSVCARSCAMLVVVVLSAWPASSRSAPTVTSAIHAAATDGPALPPDNGIAPALPSEISTETKWLPSRGRECGRHGKRRRFCQGPRRVPAPHGPEAALAAQLELGTGKTVSHLILEPPKPEWVSAAGLEDSEQLLWPVEEGMLWRGLQRAQRARAGSKYKWQIVAYADNGVRGYGNLLVTVHADNSAAFYAHCRAVYVFPGQYVVRGQIVGEVGQTGITRGPHLHFEYRKDGKLRDPLKLFAPKPTS
jgi:murein DD-endopeptidase MepM/ murein hydrolase activator NlpD